MFFPVAGKLNNKAIFIPAILPVLKTSASGKL
jgi:hypothetical protein